MSEELIRLEGVYKSYWRGDMEIPVLEGVSLSLRAGDLVALVGASGSGKSTLMNILGCLDRPSQGKYWLDGVEISTCSADARAALRNSKLGFVFQNFNLLARTTALENVKMPLNYGADHLPETECRQRAEKALRLVGLGDRMDHQPSQLSGGQQQRVAIARSLINQPRILFADEPTGNLDSRTAEDVLRVLEDLNRREGLTIIIVTHDENVGRHARRIVRIKDGVISEENRAPENPPGSPGILPAISGQGCRCEQSASPAESSPPSAFAKASADKEEERGNCRQASREGSSGGSSGPGDLNRASSRRLLHITVHRTLRMALHALRRNVMRSMLTCLGIIIGIAAVIAMMEIGRGSSYSIEQTIASLGANVIQVDPNDTMVSGVSSGAGGRVTLTPDDADAIRRECNAVSWVAPSVDTWGQVVYANRNWHPDRILGTTADFLNVRRWPVAQGRIFTDDEVRSSAAVCLLGQTVARQLFGDESPLGKDVRVRNVHMKVVGLLSVKGASMTGRDQDDFLLAPWTTVKFRVSGFRQATQPVAAAIPTPVNSLSQVYPSQQLQVYPAQSPVQAVNTPQLTRFADLDDVWISAASQEAIPAAIRQITGLLRDRHRLAPGAPDDFRIRNLTELSEALASTSKLMTKLLLVVALISLVVGGVGIMNIMLVSVTERTHEIGIRMAVGARARDILRQFLVEALVLCLAGGIVGILTGRAASIIITRILHWPTMPSLSAIIAAVAVSASVGVLFGYYPAWKASRLDPIEALRYE